MLQPEGDYTRGGVDIVATLIAQRGIRRRERHRSIEPRAVLACGESACSRIITIYDDGSQTRGKRGEALVTLDQLPAPLIITKCMNHGGSRFPTTAEIDVALGYEPVSESEARQRVIGAGYDTSSDRRTYAEIARANHLVARTEVDLRILGLSEFSGGPTDRPSVLQIF